MQLKRQDLWISIALFILFVCIATPGIGWGTPNFWHPDELVKNVDKQIGGIRKIDASYFNHPFLPPNVMMVIGKIEYSLGFSHTVFILTVRFINVLLSAGIAILAYLITRLIGGSVLAALVAAGLVISSSEIAVNARIAHDDIPLAFFTTLAVLFLIQYRKYQKPVWVYLAFFTIGLSAASKYNGVSLILAPLAIIFWDHRSELRGRDFRVLRTVSIGIGLVVLGFGLGSPQVFLYFSNFLNLIATTMRHHAEFNASPNSLPGIFGQWSVLYGLLGAPAFVLCMVAVLYALVGSWSKKPAWERQRGRRNLTAVVLLAILALDLPMLVVRNHPARFFVTLIPLLAVLAGLMIEDIYSFAKERYGYLTAYGTLGLTGVIIFLALTRVVSIILLYYNDARIPASDYIADLPASASVEYTVYSPAIPDHYFKRKRNYPLFFPKSLVTGVPGDEAVKDINTGEKGLEKRKPDYLIVDSFISDRFDDPQTCEQIPVECDFFRRLLSGETNYELDKVFEYRLPGYLPDLKPFFLNPTIRIYKRNQ